MFWKLVAGKREGPCRAGGPELSLVWDSGGALGSEAGTGVVAAGAHRPAPPEAVSEPCLPPASPRGIRSAASVERLWCGRPQAGRLDVPTDPAVQRLEG